MQKIKLALIGCGKVTETFHLPAAKQSEDFEITALVDKNLAQARRLATQYNVPVVEDDFKNIYGKADAAIVALPHHLHGSVGLQLIRNGMHVLVEKPMSLKTSECDTMIKASQNIGVTLSVGLLRRYYQAAGFVKQMMNKNMLGNIISFDFREGYIFSWQSASDFMFRKFAGGGVMVDTGIHTLDTLLWWLGEYDEVDYYDDAAGGVEANAELHLQLQNGAKGIVELSRTRTLRNTYIIKGELGSLEIGLGVNPEIKLYANLNGTCLTGQVFSKTFDKNNKDVFVRQLKDFSKAIRKQVPPFISGFEARKSVQLLETCYAHKRLLQEPWLSNLKETI